jgi:hypothetical protein
MVEGVTAWLVLDESRTGDSYVIEDGRTSQLMVGPGVDFYDPYRGIRVSSTGQSDDRHPRISTGQSDDDHPRLLDRAVGRRSPAHLDRAVGRRSPAHLDPVRVQAPGGPAVVS